MPLRLLQHPQVHDRIVGRTAKVFDCPGCGKEFYMRGGRVQPDGTLRCRDCDTTGDRLIWCPSCHEAKPYQQFGRSGNQHRTCDSCRERERQRGDHVTYDLVCAHCGTTFSAKRQDARYHSGRCRIAAHRARKKAEQAGEVPLATS